MADFTETQTFVIDVHGVADVKAAEAAVRAEEEAAKQARAANQLFADSLETMGRQAGRATPHIDGVGRSVTSFSNGFAGSFRQNITAASYALQDFTSTSGDLGQKLNSITNNLPMLFAGMGGLGVAISTAATAATALYNNWDSVTALFTTRNPFPEATTDLEGLEKQLDKAKEAMEKLKTAGSGTAEEMERYKTLREDVANIETRIAEQKERQALVDEAMKSRSKEDRERGQAFDEASAGRVPQLRADIIAGTNKQADREIKRFKDASDERLTNLMLGGANIEELAKAAEVEKAAIASYSKTVKSGIEQLADQLIADLRKGKPEAVTKLRNLMDAGTGIVIGGNGFRKAFEDAQPEAKAKAKEEEATRNLIAEHEDVALADKALADQNKAKDEAKRKADQQKKTEEQEATRQHEHNEAVKKRTEQAREQMDRELEAGLGDDFIAAGQRRMLEIGQMRGRDKTAAQEQFRNEYRDAAFNQLRSRGVGKTRASELSASALGFTDRDLGDQISRLSDANGGRMSRQELFATLYEMLGEGGGGAEMHPDVAGMPTDVRPRRGFRSVPPTAPGGGGFRSVPPTGPGPAGTPTAAAAAVGADDVVQAIGRMANVVQAGFAMTSAHIKRIDEMTAQLARGLQVNGGAINTALRRQQQQGDSYLETRW